MGRRGEFVESVVPIRLLRGLYRRRVAKDVE